MVAQLVELWTHDQEVVGSNPTQAKLFTFFYPMFCKEVVNLCIYMGCPSKTETPHFSLGKCLIYETTMHFFKLAIFY